jgi:Na+/pantothenate symporter
VFDLVILAWSTLASAFAPLLIVLARQHRPSEVHSLAMMAIGTATALLWRYAGLHDEVYEGLPGILAGLAAYYVPVWLRLTAPTDQPAGRSDEASSTLRTMTKSR